MVDTLDTSVEIPYDVLYTASIKETLWASESDAKCRIVAYDEPIAAIKHFHGIPKCTLFAIKVCKGWQVDDSPFCKVYTYMGPGNKLSVVQKIILCPTHYLNDWVDMNYIANTKLD